MQTMAFRALLLLSLCGLIHGKIVVVDNMSELRGLWEDRSAAPRQGYQRGVAAVGFQFDRGIMWSVICDSKHGMVPGKMDSKGEAWYPWGGREFGCPKVTKVVSGALFRWDRRLPRRCKAQGRQHDSGYYHSALIQSAAHGLVPGKAKRTGRKAWYCWGGKEYYVRSNFYILC